MNEVFVRRKLEEFLLEDLGAMEVPASPESGRVVARILVEEEGVFCGGKLIASLFNLLTSTNVPPVRMKYLRDDGDSFASGDVVAEFDVDVEVLRHGIRTLLNLLQHMSGIATNTRKTVEQTYGLSTKLLDTRKTTPGLRAFEKYAVRVGGGVNHRHGRFDGILIKKEDIKIDGGILNAIDNAFRAKSHLVAVEIEVETLGELETVAADGRVKYVLLDNMDFDKMAEAVRRYGRNMIFEASGIGDKDLRKVAETGVHYISLSSLTRGAHPTKMKMRIADR